MSKEFYNDLNNIIESEQEKLYSKYNPVTKFFVSFLLIFYIFLDFNLFRITIWLIIILGYILLFIKEFPILKPRKRFIIMFSASILIVQLLFVSEGEILFHLIPSLGNSPPMFPIRLVALVNGCILTFRFLIVICISLILVNTTDPNEFAYSLNSIRVPYRFAYVLVLALNFTPLFEFELETIQNAQQSRGLSVTSSNLRGLYNIIRSTLLPLIGSTLLRVKEVTISMDGRAFGAYEKKTFLFRSKFSLKDIFLILIILVGLIVVNNLIL